MFRIGQRVSGAAVQIDQHERHAGDGRKGAGKGGQKAPSHGPHVARHADQQAAQ